MKFELESLWHRGSRAAGSLGQISRAKVIGGWLVNSYSWFDEVGISESMVFIPDPEHLWEIDND
jgi:hypothetical protein